MWTKCKRIGTKLQCPATDASWHPPVACITPSNVAPQKSNNPACCYRNPYGAWLCVGLGKGIRSVERIAVAGKQVRYKAKCDGASSTTFTGRKGRSKLLRLIGKQAPKTMTPTMTPTQMLKLLMLANDQKFK